MMIAIVAATLWPAVTLQTPSHPASPLTGSDMGSGFVVPTEEPESDRPPLTVPPTTAGASSDFLMLVESIREALSQRKFEEAEKLVQLLPVADVRVSVDDRRVPADRKAEYRDAVDRALGGWRELADVVRLVRVPAGGDARPVIRVSFVDRLAPPEGQTEPRGAAITFANEPGEIPIELTIALARGLAEEQATGFDVHNEVLYAIAVYFGIAASPVSGSAASRSDAPYATFHRASTAEMFLANENLALAARLRQAVQERRTVEAQAPRIAVDPPRHQVSGLTQGDSFRFSIQITNTGSGLLQLRTSADCGCVVLARVPSVAPGQTVLLPVTVDTTDFPGKQLKRVFIYSNDAEDPLHIVPIEFEATPAFRFLSDVGQNVLVGPGGSFVPIVLALPDGTSWRVRRAQVDGVEATVTYEPWRGQMADPELGEGPRARSGYRFVVAFPPNSVPGRRFATLVVETDSDQMPVLRYSMMVQSGIVALPERVFFGNITAEPRRAAFLLSRPGAGFRILGIESDEKSLTASARPVRGNEEYRIEVLFDGKAPIGRMDAVLTIRTDDPAQPEIRVPVLAVIR